MSKPVRTWAVVLAATILTGMEHTATASSDYNLGLLTDIMAKDPTQLCPYVTCQEPVSPETCPDGTTYLENASQFGCCGACVSFRQNGEFCTGNIDPLYGGGYTRGSSKLSDNVLDSLYNVSKNNILHSSWCDYSFQCLSRDNKIYVCTKRKRLVCYTLTSYSLHQLHNELIYDTSIPSYKAFSHHTPDKSPIKFLTLMQICPNTVNITCRNMLDNYLRDVLSSDYKPYRDDYRWEPVCNRQGKFDAKQCMGPRDKRRCVCVDPEGNRIFGLAFPEQEELYSTMNCKCSRDVWEKRQAGQTAVTLHCEENGNYEELQCEDEMCYCVDPATGDIYGSRLPEDAMHMLPCFNRTLAGEKYLRRCDSQLYAHAKLLDALAESGLRGPETLVTCDQDGSFSGKQCDQDTCRCWDKYFYQNLAVQSGEDCQCVEDLQFYKEINALITVTCKVNSGAYAEEQSQGSYKYCVDEDGIRSGPLVHVNKNDDYTLDCDNAKRCQKYGLSDTLDGCLNVCLTIKGDPCPDEAYPAFSPP